MPWLLDNLGWEIPCSPEASGNKQQEKPAMKLVSSEEESEKKGAGGERQPLPAGQGQMPTSADAEQPHHAQQK